MLKLLNISIQAALADIVEFTALTILLSRSLLLISLSSKILYPKILALTVLLLPYLLLTAFVSTHLLLTTLFLRTLLLVKLPSTILLSTLPLSISLHRYSTLDNASFNTPLATALPPRTSFTTIRLSTLLRLSIPPFLRHRTQNAPSSSQPTIHTIHTPTRDSEWIRR